MKFKRFTVSLLCIATLVSSIFVSFASAPDSELGYSKEELKSMERYDKTFLQNQGKANESYEKLASSLGKIDSSDYPEYYGGSYINPQGKLVIKTIGNSYNAKNEFKRRLENNDFIVENCKYSFKSLSKIIDTLNNYKQKNATAPICTNFNNYYLSDAQNNIVVYLDEYNQEQIEKFKKQIIDSPAIEFKKSTDKFQDEISVNPGCGITCNGGTGSMGFRAIRNGVIGFVTAGHLAPLNSTLQHGGISFATCTARQYSGSVDASFCRIDDTTNFTPTNTLQGTSNTLSTTISEPGVGTVINKIGFSTGQTSGTIISTNASATVDGITFTNLTTANYTSAPGDSGCIIYSYIASTNTRLTLGIHKGAIGSTRYYVKANQINSALGTSRY